MPVTTKRERLLEVIRPGFEVVRGRALPLGSTVERGGVNFAVVSEHAIGITLVLYGPGDSSPLAEFPLDSRYNRTGNIWHAFVAGLDSGVAYGYRAEGDPGLSAHLHRYDAKQVLFDPYARGTVRVTVPVPAGEETEGRGPQTLRLSAIVDSQFDWEQDQPLDIPLEDSILYELHVGAFTRHASSWVTTPGTFSGLADKIPYLRELGVTAIELMPVVEFNEDGNPRHNPQTGEKLTNFWGYHPLSLFSPHLPYGRSMSPTGTLTEMKQMVKAFHAAGIEVILDIVFNHTGEGDAPGNAVSLRGLDRAIYYMLDPQTGEDRNYSGCGNTLNCNHPIVRDLLLDCLRYWVTELHVDGFRFDLASILGRGMDGQVLANPPLIEKIAADPVLARTKLIAEAWDASGLYQVGSFPSGQRWAEWNGKFRDDLRSYVRGDPGMARVLATRLAGSADLYQSPGRAPYHSVNFITCHDGFTMADLVAYNEKHNQANGEDGRDGCNHNVSWNCGAEGNTDDQSILSLRQQQVKNFATLLLFSHGVPMLLYGDEAGRSQQGNNNAYCQDNETSWMDWTQVDQNRSLFLFFRRLIAFRRAHRALRRASFVPLPGEPQLRMDWHGTSLERPDWGGDSRSLALHLSEIDAGQSTDHLYLISNAYWKPLQFALPQDPGWRWTRFVDTGAGPAVDITEPDHELELMEQNSYQIEAQATVVLVGRQ